MHERQAEVEVVRDAVAGALAGRGSALLLEGPAGIGKTTLLTAALQEASARGLTTLRTRGTELERSHPFGGARRLLAQPAAGLGDAAFAGPGAAARAALDDRPVDAGPDEPTAARLLGLVAVLGALCDAHGPVIVAADDAHCLDDPTLDMLAMLSARLDELPVVLAVAARTGGAELGPSLGRLAADPAVIHLPLAPLGREGVAAVLAERLGQAAGDEVVDASLEATGGNPWFVTAVAAEMALDPDAADAASVRGRIPPALAAAVRARVAAASPDATAVACALLVLGDGVQPRLIAAHTGLGLDQTSAALDGLARAGVIGPDRPPRYSHAIVRSAVEADFGAGERALDHRRAARLLADENAPPEQVAAQLIAAEPAGDEWALDALLDAAAVARARGAPDRAAAILERALSEPPPAGRRRAVLSLLGAAELEAGRGHAAVRHLTGALDGGGPETVDTARRLAQAQASLGLVPDAVVTLENALDGRPLGDSDRAVLTADLTGLGTFSPAVGSRARTRLAALGDVSESTPAGRLVLAARARDLMMAGRDLDQTVRAASRALDGGRLASESAVWIVWSYAVLALTVAGREADARAEIDRALRGVIHRASVGWYGAARTLRADIGLRTGDIESALADALGAIEAMHDNDLTPLPSAVGYLAGAHVERDEIDDAERVLREHDLDGELPEHLLFFPVLYERARVRLARGDAEAAADDLLELGRRESAWGVRNPCTAPWRVAAVRTLRQIGRDEEARGLAQEQHDLAACWPTCRSRTLGELALGLVEPDREAAERRFAAAVAEARDAVPLERITALIELGRTIRQRGERERARGLLREALAAADASGARRLAREAETELRAARGRPPRLRAAADELTPSERRIAELASDGASNREIASSLFVAVRTVETHLTSAYRRLGISSRHELAGALARDRG